METQIGNEEVNLGNGKDQRDVHLLVIRLSAMGDVAMTVPVLSALLQQHPYVRITVLTKGFLRPLFEGLPRLVVKEADVKGKHKGVLGLWKLYKELKDLDIDLVADLHNVLRSNVLKAYFGLESTPFVQIDKGRAEKKALTSLKKKKFLPLKTTHQRYADVFEALGFPLSLENLSLLSRRTIALDTQKVLKGVDKPWIGIAPFAAFEGKMYPLELMEEVVAGLNEKDNYQILLFGGGEKEKLALESWESKYRNCINMVGKIPFKEELSVISNLHLMIAMDSGNAHLAAMFGVPTLTIWGVTHPYAGFYPFAQKGNTIVADREQFPLIPTSVYGNKFPPGYENAMKTIAPSSILKKAFEILENQPSIPR